MTERFISFIIHLFMRIWRNWQTRWFQVPVGDHAGSTPVIRTKKMTLLFVGVIFFLVRILQELRGGKAEIIFCRRAADSTAVLTALGLGCQPCAALKRLLLFFAFNFIFLNVQIPLQSVVTLQSILL